MITKVEGIVLSKIKFQDRSQIISLLLRNGKKIRVIFYGGLGGGPKKKSSVLELGHLIKVELNRKSKPTDIFTAKEWVLGWSYKNIRNSYQDYYFLCFYLELITKMATEENLEESYAFEDETSEGLFRVLSNAIFFLEEKSGDKIEQVYGHLILFLAKLSLDQGITTALIHRVLCDSAILVINKCLAPEHGGFICENCSSGDQVNFNAMRVDQDLFDFFLQVIKSKYQDFLFQKSYDRTHVVALLNYFCYQFGIERKSFKTLSLIL